MNLARPVKVTKVRQRHSAHPVRKPGLPYNGPNFVAQREASAKKSARKVTTSRSGGK